MFEMSTIHANTVHMHSNDYAIAQSLPWCGPAASILAQQMFFQLIHIMDPRTVDGPLLNDTPYASCSPPYSNLANWVANKMEG